MNYFSKDKFKELAIVNQAHCISIYIPTHRAGQEVNEKIDRINLKNQVQKVTRELENWQLGKREIDELLKPVNELVNDTSFWNNQSDGLAIFRTKNSFDFITLPTTFEEFIYVSDHFYLKPLITYLNDTGKYYLLALSLSEVKFFEGYPHQINEVEVHDLLPEHIEDAVGYDFKEKHLQFRSGHAGAENAIYHGHGKGNEEVKPEIIKYFRAINNGLMKIINTSKRPLVLATVDYLVPLYKEVNEYGNLWKDSISGNPEHEDPILLHEKARELLKDYFNQDKKLVRDAFEKTLSNNLASYKEEEIIPAAFNQRIDTLMVKNGENLWGIFDKDINAVKPRTQQPEFKSCLLNFAAIQTILNGGKVYLMDPDEMPLPEAKLSAVYRF